MSTLWTPSGEHEPHADEPAGARPDPDRPNPARADSAAGGPETAEEAEALEELRRVRAELAATPVADIIANHAVGLWQLAVLHLLPEDGQPPGHGQADLVQAGLAIDAMAGLVEGLGDRLGENAEPLRDALTQLRLMFVQVSEGPSGAAPESS